MQEEVLKEGTLDGRVDGLGAGLRMVNHDWRVRGPGEIELPLDGCAGQKVPSTGATSPEDTGIAGVVPPFGVNWPGDGAMAPDLTSTQPAKCNKLGTVEGRLRGRDG